MLAPDLRAQSLAILHDIAIWNLREQGKLLESALINQAKAGFNPSQPRVPSGSSQGGQWTSDLTYQGDPDLPLDSVYPIETALLGLASGVVGGFLRIATAIWRGVTSAGGQFDDLISSIEKFFGGKPERVFRNPKGDIVMMGGGKKIRFDITKVKNDKAHFHIQEFVNGKWVNVIKHRHYFKQ